MKITRAGTFCIELCLLLTVAGCYQRRSNIRRHNVYLAEQYPTHCVAQENTVPTVAVFVHGTRFMPRWMFKNRIPPGGLTPLTELTQYAHIQQSANIFVENSNGLYSADHTYAFCWSGALSFKEREAAAQLLYQELVALQTTYTARYDCVAPIHLITHSHGGNVALSMPLCYSPENPCYIDELILIACPIQARTMHLCNHPMFGMIHSVYSPLDIVQVLDPQGLYRHPTNWRLFSERKLPRYEKVAQAKVKINGHALLHTQFMSPRYIKYLPSVISILRDQQTAHRYDPSKNHLICLYENRFSRESHYNNAYSA